MTACVTHFSKDRLKILTLVSWYQHRYCKILCFPYKIKGKKTKTLLTNTNPVLIYLAPVACTFNYLSRGIHWWSSEKIWIFGALIHLHLEKIVAKKVLGNVPVKHPISSPKFKHICRPFRRVKDDSPQEVHVRFRNAK